MADPYLSELKYLGNASVDFIEVAVDAGADVSNLVVTIYNSNGTVRSSNAVAGLTKTTVAGKDIYIIESGAPSSFNGLGNSNAVALSDSGTVYAFKSFDNTPAEVTATEGPADTMTSDDVGRAGTGSSLETTDGGATYTTQTTPTPGSIPCFTAGTFIRTKGGACRVEALTEGTLVETLDGEMRPLVKVLRTIVAAQDLKQNPKLRPVRICAGALGDGLPERDLLVSRQHRMLVSSPIVSRMFGIDQVLVAAAKLTALPGIYVDLEVQPVTYLHLLFERHEVVFAEGAPAESLYLGAEAMKALPSDVREEVQAIFPELVDPLIHRHGCPPIPSDKRQSRLVARHVLNGRALLASSAPD